jgi:hypothetical protein
MHNNAVRDKLNIYKNEEEFDHCRPAEALILVDNFSTIPLLAYLNLMRQCHQW